MQTSAKNSPNCYGEWCGDLRNAWGCHVQKVIEKP